MDSTLLSDKIAATLEEEILSGDRSLGARLDEREIAQQFNSSRTPVREALRSLSGVGLVQMSGRHGTTVTKLSLNQLLDSFRVVSELEAIAADQAASRITEDQVDRLLGHQSACEEAYSLSDVETFCNANNLLHATILEASGNSMLRDQMRMARILSPYRRHITNQPGRMATSITEHAAFIEAIRSGDGATAAEQMRRHVDALATGISDFLYFLDRTGRSDIIS